MRRAKSHVNEKMIKAPSLTFKEITGSGGGMRKGSEKPPEKENRRAEMKEGTQEGQGYGHLAKDLNVPGETLPNEASLEGSE